MPTQKLTFKNARGETLIGRLDLPVDGVPDAYALFAHCFTCSKDLTAVRTIGRALNRAGIAVFRFDFTGLGESEGDFADTNVSSNVDDLVDAANFVADTFEMPSLLIGHSLGGAAVLMAAERLPEVGAIVTIGAPAQPEHVTHLLQDSLAEIEASGEACVRLAGREFTIKKQFLDDLEGTNMERIIGNLRRPLLVLHSPVDNTVGIDNARAIFQVAKHPKSFVSLDSADHLLSRPSDATAAGNIIAGWARAYLPARRRPSWHDDIHDNRTVVRTEEGLRTEVMANGFGLVVDEPLAVGGTNSGPTPYDYLAAALGSCTSMTLRMYADRKGWPLEAVTVEIDHSRVHAEDCRDCEQETSRMDRFERTVTLEGDLDESQRQRLLQIANRCPVHRTLESQIQIDTQLA